MDIGGDDLLFSHEDNGNNAEPVNISDVLDAIDRADPSYGAVGGVETMAQPPVMPQASVQIVEQPAPRALRFRYECEGRSAGSLPGANSTPENKTYPTIRINNYIGTVTIVVSCVTKEEPFRPHPHNLVGRDRCQRGVCTIKTGISEDVKEYQFKNLGIQCIRKRDIPEALNVRDKLRVDPFRTGFDHRNHPQSIDLNAVRLAFQVFVQDPNSSRLLSLPPVASDVIYDKKATCEPLITRASHCSGPIRGGTHVILLCEKVSRDDLAVVFYEEQQGQLVWEVSANIILVHKLVAVVFEVPPYHTPGNNNVNVNFQLKRLSDNGRSNSLPFEYISVQDAKRKKKALMPAVYELETRGYIPEDVKQEPNLSPKLCTSPATTSYAEQAQHWTNLDAAGPAHEYAAWGGYSPQTQLAAPLQLQASPQDTMHVGHVSPNPMSQLSPLGPVHSPLSQVHSPMSQVHSPLGPSISPGLVQQIQHQQLQQQQLQQQQIQQQQQQHLLQQQQMQQMQMQQMQQRQIQTYQVDDQMDIGAGPSMSLYGADEFLSLSALVEERENLSDSLRNLSTSELIFKQTHRQ